MTHLTPPTQPKASGPTGTVPQLLDVIGDQDNRHLPISKSPPLADPTPLMTLSEPCQALSPYGKNPPVPWGSYPTAPAPGLDGVAAAVVPPLPKYGGAKAPPPKSAGAKAAAPDQPSLKAPPLHAPSTGPSPMSSTGSSAVHLSLIHISEPTRPY